jgi:hypothetical protein
MEPSWPCFEEIGQGLPREELERHAIGNSQLRIAFDDSNRFLLNAWQNTQVFYNIHIHENDRFFHRLTILSSASQHKRDDHTGRSTAGTNLHLAG